MESRASTSDDALIVLSVIWTDEGCHLRVRRPGEPSEIIAAPGLELHYRCGPDSARHCIGHHSPRKNNGAYVDCQNPPQPGEKTCVSCAVANAEFAGDLHHAHTKDRAAIDRSVLDHLSQANVLYLAAFRDGSVKVGTSTGTRKDKRLTEQGAWRAIEVATVTDGFTVRRLEDRVTERLGLPQSVAIGRKLAGMASPMSDERLQATLDPLVLEVHDLIAAEFAAPTDAGAGGAEASVVATAEPWSFPKSDDPGWRGLHAYPARLDTGTHHVIVEAMCGRMAVLTRPGSTDRFVADLGQLYGIELDRGDYQPDQLAVQDSLF